jgi:glycosyltransferase involved in cell wall biosynthesis
MVKKPTVSILIPTYNAGAFLDETIKSVLEQSFEDYELIIVDNASTDNTNDIITPYLIDERISYYKNPFNIGMVNNWNKCLEYAHGQYIKFLMADDKFHPQMLEKYVAVMDQYPKVSLVTCNRGHIGLKTYTWELPFQHLQDGKKVIYDNLRSCNWIGEPTTVMIRKSNLYLGKFKPQYTYLPDWDMWLRHLSVGDCYIIPETLSYFRVHENQLTSNLLGSAANYLEEYHFFKEIQKYNPYGIDFQVLNIDEIIKQKAASCLKALIKLTPQLHKAKSRALFINSLKPLLEEGVVFRSISVLFQTLKRNRFETNSTT